VQQDDRILVVAVLAGLVIVQVHRGIHPVS
jgi:hypothetical protein